MTDSNEDQRSLNSGDGMRTPASGAPALGSATPPAGARHLPSLPPSRLPAQTTSFIGRERELLTVVCQILSPQVRLVTLTGPGGIGKTRLAIEAGSNLLNAFRDGVFFVPLAPVQEAGAALLAIARAVGLMDRDDRPQLDALEEHLREREVLLVLDNSEHVIAALVVVNQLLEGCPNLKLLVTSRAALNIRGEYLLEVPALGLPPSKRLIGLEDAEKSDAVKLFTERAAAIRQDFVLTQENAADVVEICRRLEGIPLAIELVAARAKMFTPQAMLVRLTSRLKLLGGALEDLPERQRTMRSAIGWSYELLDPEEQQLFQRLSAFPGGCTLESAETVCNGDLGIDLMDGIDSLVRKSLLRTEERAEQMRFFMLETIREYGLEMLQASGKHGEMCGRCVDFLLKMVEAAEPELTGPRQATWMAQLEAEHNNLRFVLKWGIESGEPEQSLQIAGALWRFWANRGHLSEGRKWLTDALSATASADGAIRARALRGAGNLAWRQSDLEAAEELQAECLAMSRRLGDLRGVAAALNNLGGIALHMGDRKKARELGEEALAIYRRLQDKNNMALLLSNLGCMAGEWGDFQTAAAQLEEGLAMSREMGDTWRIALALVNLGVVATLRKDHARARAYCSESLETSRQAGNQFMVATALGQLGEITVLEGDYTAAASYLRESIEISRDMSSLRGVAQSLDRFAALDASCGIARRAARLLGAADSLREALRVARAPGEQALYKTTSSKALQALGKDAFTSALVEGTKLTAEQATEEALENQGVDPLARGTNRTAQGDRAVPLTSRELEVARLVARGLTNAEIAEELVISPRTAETHVNHVLNRLGYNSRAQIAAWVMKKGLGTS